MEKCNKTEYCKTGEDVEDTKKDNWKTRKNVIKKVKENKGEMEKGRSEWVIKVTNG